MFCFYRCDDPSSLGRRASKLVSGIFLRALLDRTFVGDRTDFDDRAVFKTGALLGDLNRLILVRDRKIELTANRFLRFRKWTVGDCALSSRYDFPFVFQRMT